MFERVARRAASKGHGANAWFIQHVDDVNYERRMRAVLKEGDIMCEFIQKKDNGFQKVPIFISHLRETAVSYNTYGGAS